jgi:[ribosomal protein S5]-alanine N-acetyltransferase
VIRPVTVDDAEELCALYRANRDFLVPFEPTREESFYTVQGQRDRLEHHVQDAAAGDGWRFAIMDDGAIAGTINVGDVIRGPLQLANIGYFVDRPRNGRGLATGAVADVVDFAFGELGLHRLEAGTLPDNFASQRVLEKNGFERYGLARRLLLIGGTWYDHVLFELLND